MTLLQIEFFLEIAKRGSFTKAAEHFYISHQALSSQIKALESELDLVLFDRSNRKRITLTDAGKLLFNDWSIYLGMAKESLQKARQLEMQKRNTLRFGVQDIPLIHRHIMDATRQSILKDFKYTVEYVEGTPEELLSMLDEGSLDMCCMFSYQPAQLQPFSYIVFQKTATPAVIVVSRDNPLSKKRKLKLSDLADETIIILDNNYSPDIEIRIRSDFEQADVPIKKVKYAKTVPEIMMALVADQGVTIMLEPLCEGYPQLKKYPLDIMNQPGSEIILVWKENHFKKTAELIAQK